jgi:hypothetical protein
MNEQIQTKPSAFGRVRSALRERRAQVDSRGTVRRTFDFYIRPF